MKILLDNGHGIEIPGKRSPDGVLLEYAYNREIARAIHEHLQLRGIDSELVVPEEADISLYERCRPHQCGSHAQWDCRHGGHIHSRQCGR